ncbi:MAG: hypothetical protein ACLP9L_39685 [Thermoguttaceae bacterium]
MPISIQCPGCGKKLTAKDELAGKKATCPGCKKVLVIPTARPLSQPKPPAPAKPATATAKPAVRRRKRNLLPLYIGGGVVVLCLAIVLMVIFSMSGGDRSVAKNTDLMPKADTTHKTEARPAPKPERRPEPAKPDTTPKPEVKNEPTSEPKPQADGKQSAKSSEEEKLPDKAVPRTADVPKEPAVDRQSIEQVENLMKELGFTLIADLGESPDMHVPGPDGKDYEFNVWTCENKNSGATLSLTRNMTLAVATHVPGPRYEIRASHAERNRKALMELCEKISPSLERAAQECVAQYERTKRPAEKPVEKIKVYVDRTGTYIESIPAVIPGFHFTAAGREAGGITD